LPRFVRRVALAAILLAFTVAPLAGQTTRPITAESQEVAAMIVPVEKIVERMERRQLELFAEIVLQCRSVQPVHPVVDHACDVALQRYLLQFPPSPRWRESETVAIEWLRRMIERGRNLERRLRDQASLPMALRISPNEEADLRAEQRNLAQELIWAREDLDGFIRKRFDRLVEENR
jgi:hypothetical protein